MAERGSRIKRRLDFLLGVPLTAVLGRVRRAARPPRSLPLFKEPPRVGVLCLGAIGDLLLASGLLEALRSRLAQSTITVIASRANGAALDLLDPSLGRAVFSVTDMVGLLRFLRKQSFDLLLDTSQWARLGALASIASGAKRTVGFATPGQYRHYGFDLAVEHRNDRHEADNFLALAQAVFPGADGAPRLHVPAHVSSQCPVLPDERLVFCHMWPAGLSSRVKEWPAESWAELARRLAARGFRVAFTGGKPEAAATSVFLDKHLREEAGLGKVFSLAGAVSLADLAVLFSRAKAVLSVNTGVMHLAALAGAPTIALNGPTNPLRWGPLGSRTRSLQPGRGEFAYLNLGFEYPPGAEQVLKYLEVDTVWAALEEWGIGG